MENHNTQIYNEITLNDIDSITKNSSLALLKALYQCEHYIVCNKNGEPIINKEKLNYKSSFYLSFINNVENLDETYLQTRKNLYKSIKLLRNDKNSNIKLPIFHSQNKNTTIIFLDSLDSKISMSNLIHIYNENNQTKIDIFTKHNTIIDIYELVKNYSDYGINLDSLHSVNTQIFFYSTLLNGGTESTMPYSECFFGDLDFNDSANDLDESKPIYYLECDEVDLDSSDSIKSYESNSHSQDLLESTQTLQVFLHNHKLTILNYSILDSSLNIKLECKSKESKAIQQNEQAQRDKAQIQSSTPSISTAFLCPILECDELKCTHGWQVKLTSNIGKSFALMVC